MKDSILRAGRRRLALGVKYFREGGKMPVVAEVVSLEVGAVYRFKGIGAGVGAPCRSDEGPRKGRGKDPYWIHPPGCYRLVGLATSVRLPGGGNDCGHREEVVYEGLDGAEAGRLYHCPLEDWWRCFEPPAATPEPPPGPPPLGKEIDWTERTGLGLREAFAEDARRRAAGEPTDGQLYSSAVRRDSSPVLLPGEVGGGPFTVPPAGG
jgi:hypothetical protein